MLAILLGVLPLACASAEGQAETEGKGSPLARSEARTSDPGPRESPWDPNPAPSRPRGAEGPVILELFTSQGCSSCPPADRYLASLARTGQLGGRAIVPLSFHVDYWNDLGWVDPYSLPAWTERQRQYARALGDDRVYTPEVVVGGAAGMVGSHAQKVAAAIASAARPALLAATATWARDHVEVTAEAPADADVLVAVWEEARTIAVTRGENTGETLTNHRIVRRLDRVAAAGKRGTLRVAIDPAWRGTGAVVFAQRADKRIVASALLPRT
ncbi:MAG TPA: DUF1223 domain-containing protein [Kofleriaceae bacterium]|nr:DUF1223 domain-containing protein [Kofleriaceae bacterium]